MSTSALAFSSRDKFGNPVNLDETGFESGGGGGRYFTGSPADGYTCEVCHTGPGAMPVKFNGLPEAYVPGLVYEVVMQWPIGDDRVGAMLEIVDAAGQAAGNITAPEIDDTLPLGQCTFPDKGVETVSMRSGGVRQVLGIDGCTGVQNVRFYWEAPAADQGPVELVAGIVHPLTTEEEGADLSDQEKVKDDEVTIVRRAIPNAADGQVPTPTQELKCSVGAAGAPGGSSAALSALLGLVGLALFARRR